MRQSPLKPARLSYLSSLNIQVRRKFPFKYKDVRVRTVYFSSQFIFISSRGWRTTRPNYSWPLYYTTVETYLYLTPVLGHCAVSPSVRVSQVHRCVWGPDICFMIVNCLQWDSLAAVSTSYHTQDKPDTLQQPYQHHLTNLTTKHTCLYLSAWRREENVQ